MSKARRHRKAIKINRFIFAQLNDASCRRRVPARRTLTHYPILANCRAYTRAVVRVSKDNNRPSLWPRPLWLPWARPRRR